VDEVSLDQNLSEGDGTGYDVLRAIEWWAFEDDGYEPPILRVHTDDVNSDTLMRSAVIGIENIVARRNPARPVVAEQLLAALLPDIAAEVNRVLLDAGLSDVAKQVPFLRVASRCGCGEANCQTLDVIPTGDLWLGDASAPAVVPVRALDAYTIRLDTEGAITQIEMLDREELEPMLVGIPKRNA
jgi:hypothetical protein